MSIINKSPKKMFYSSFMQFISIYGLVIFLGFLIVVFSILLPDTFPTAFNIRSTLNHQSVVILLSLAVMVPIATNNFDLSVGYLIGITHILTIQLQVKSHLPWWFVIIIVILSGTAFGYINGILVTRVGINAFIATLGSGTILYGLAFLYTGGRQVLGDMSKAFYALDSIMLGIPTSIFFVLIIVVTLWIIFEYMPLGRYLYALGANPRSAVLVGISSKRYITFAFIVSGTITAIAGVILASQLRVGQISEGPNYLLPSFAGAFLGSTSIRPGRVNVIGTVVAVMLMAVAVSGLQQMGAAFFVEPLFNGGMLILAVSLATYTAHRKISTSSIEITRSKNDSRD